MLLHVDSKAFPAHHQRSYGFIECKKGRATAGLNGRYCVTDCDRGFSASCRTQEKRAGTNVDAATKQIIESRNSTLQLRRMRDQIMLRCHEAWIELHSTMLDAVVVETLPEA